MKKNSTLINEMKLQDIIRDLDEKIVLAIRESHVKPKEIAERMNMGDQNLVNRVLDAGVSQLSMATLVRLVNACGLETHMKFIPSVAEDEKRVVRRKK